MAKQTQGRVVWGLIGLAVVAVAIYGLGRLLTSNVSSMFGVDYHAGKIKASNSSSFAQSHSTTSSSVFLIRKVAISRLDDHPVLAQVVDKLKNDLLALSFIDEVDVYDPGETHEFGGLLYDSYLTLSIDVLRDDKLFIGRDFEATIHVAAGSMPFNSRSTYTDHLSTPGINYSLNGQIDHTSQSTQAGTPYKMIVAHIAEALSGKLTEQFTKWHEEFGADVEWPGDLVGRFPEDLTIPWPDGVEMDTLVDGYGLMQHRHALWSIETDKPQAIMQAFHQTYVDAGWRIDPNAIIEKDEHNSRYHLRAWNDSPHQVEVFEVRKGMSERVPGEVSRVCVRYQHRFDRPETRRIIDRLIENDADLSVLRFLQSQMTREQEARYFQVFADCDLTDPRDFLALAKFHHRNGRDDEAKRYLMRASLHIFHVHDKPSIQRKLKEAAQEMGFDEAIVDLPITPELIAEVGYQPLQELVGNKSTIVINQAVRFCYPSQDELNTLDLWLDKDPENVGVLRLNHYERHGRGSTSWGNQGATKSGDQIYCTWHVDSDSGGYTVHIRQNVEEPDLFDVDFTTDSSNKESNS